MAARSDKALVRSVAIWTSVAGIALAVLVALGATATEGPGRGLKTLLLVGTPWFLGLVPAVIYLPCWLMRALWAGVVLWGAMIVWLTLTGGLGFIILPLTLLYVALLIATWMNRRSNDKGLCS